MQTWKESRVTRRARHRERTAPQVVARSGVGAAARAFALTNGVGLAFCWVGGAALDHLGGPRALAAGMLSPASTRLASSVASPAAPAAGGAAAPLRGWLLCAARVGEEYVDEVLAALRKEQVSSLEDLQLLSEQPHFTQCFAAITVVKISRALLAQAEPGAHPPKRPLLLEECEAAAVLRAREDERLRGQLLRTREDERREQLLDAMWLATWGAWLATTLQRAWRGRRARHAAERAAADAAAAASFVRRWCFVQLRPEIARCLPPLIQHR